MSDIPENCPAGTVSSAIFGALVSQEPIAASAFRQLYQEPEDPTEDSQIRTANQFWRQQLSRIDSAEATNAKMCLEDGIGFDLWIHNFCEGVAPLVIQHELPCNYTGPSLADKYDVDEICRSLSSCSSIQLKESNHGERESESSDR